MEPVESQFEPGTSNESEEIFEDARPPAEIVQPTQIHVAQPTMLILKLHLPPWNAEDPTFWFHRVEQKFNMAKNPDGTRYELTATEKVVHASDVVPPR